MRASLRAILLSITMLVMGIAAQTAAATPADGDAESAINSVLQKPNLKILHIGNSYTFDPVSYLPQIIEGTGSDVSDMCIYRTMRPGGSYKTWYDAYNNADDTDYQIEKVCGGIDANISTGNAAPYDGSLLRKALTDEQWDIIFIQPVSTYAPYYEEWRGNGPGGYLDELVDIIKTNQPNAALGILLVHSYASSLPTNTEGSSLLRWEKIVDAVDKCCLDFDIDIVLPYGTAVQNLRASSMDNGYDLTADGIHCELILTRYVASCCYYQTIIAPRSGVSVLEDKTRINAALVPTGTSVISVDDTTAPIAQKAAVMAVADWHTCANPETDYAVGIKETERAGMTETTEDAYTLSGVKASVARGKNGIVIKNHRKVAY